MGGAKKYMIEICDDCYALEGGVCHNPDCAFYCHDMETVGEVLDILLTRPAVNGERLSPQTLAPAIEVYADGGCAGNGTDHQKAYGSYKIGDWTPVRQVYGNRTSNEAEYLALIDALRALNAFQKTVPLKGIEIIAYTDSKLLEGQLTKRWKVLKPHLRPLVDEAGLLLRDTGAKLVRVGREKMVEVLGH